MPPPFVLARPRPVRPGRTPSNRDFPGTRELHGDDHARPGLAPARLTCDRSSAIGGIEPCDNRLPRAASYAIIPYIS